MKKGPIQDLPYADLLDNAPVIIAVHDLDNNIVWANKAYQKATELSLHEIEGKKCYSVWRLSHPCRNCPVTTVIETGEPAEAELTPQNQEHWPDSQGPWLSKAAPIRDEGGNIIAAIEIAHDITERKQVEDALRESEEKFRNLYENSPFGILICQMLRNEKREFVDFIHIEENQSVHINTGFELNQLIGKKASEIVDSKALTELVELYGSVISTGQPIHYEQHFDVYDRTLDVTAFPLHDDFFIINFINVSKRKQVEEALRESETQKTAILDASIDRIRLVDRDFRIIWANKTTTRELNVTPEELVGKICYEVFVERDTPCPACPMIKALKSGKIEHAVLHQPTSKGINGASYWDTYAVPVKDKSGNIVNLIEISRNISEKKKAEEEKERLEAELRQSQKMQAISTLAGGIAHDFNNILTSILGYTQLAQMKLDPEDAVYGDLKEVLQSGNRAKILIQQILAIGRSQEQERQPMQLKHIVREALKFLKSTLPSTIEVREKWDQDIGIIDADPTQMHQVLMNLCTNAGHAMEKNGGILKVSLRNVAVVRGKLESGAHLEPGPYLRLSVSDTGYGIAPEIREQIFDPYFTSKEPGEGTGIGLSVVHGIVIQHGGDITVESEPGKGSTFHVYLPLTRAEEEQSAVKEETPLPRGNERILLIDDEAVLARMGKEMLESLEYDVTAMTGSIEALALFKEDPKQFDLVITDTTMPHMPGDILAQEMMKIRPDIPIIIYTGHSKRISKEKAKEMGIKGFLMKPLAIRDLAGMVRKVLDEK